MKPSKLIVPTVLLCAMAQVNATMMQYNTSNQLVRSDNQTMTYSPKGYLASVDNVHIIHGGGDFIEQVRSMTATVFGGVRLLSNGVAQSIFTDNHSTLKTSSADKVSHSYTDPYGNAVSTPKVKGDSYPLERNRMTYDGGYQINNDLINFNARSYIPSIKRFTSNDSYDVPNRYNFSDGNPVMKFDPSGHNAKSALNLIGNVIFGVQIGNLLLGNDKEMGEATKNALIVVGAIIGAAAVGGVIAYIINRNLGMEVAAEMEVENAGQELLRDDLGASLNNDHMAIQNYSAALFRGEGGAGGRSFFDTHVTTLQDSGADKASRLASFKVLKNVSTIVNDDPYGTLELQLRSRVMAKGHYEAYINNRFRANGEGPVTIAEKKFSALMSAVRDTANDMHLGGNLRTDERVTFEFFDMFFDDYYDKHLKSKGLTRDGGLFIGPYNQVKATSYTDAITMEKFKHHDKIKGHVVGDKFHGFYESSIDNWLASKKDGEAPCPYCKAPLNGGNLTYGYFNINNVST